MGSSLVVNKRAFIGSFLTLVWWILTGIYNHNVLTAYHFTNLPNALLTVDSIFFAGVVVFISIVISMTGIKETYKPAMEIIRPLTDLAGAIALLLIANLSSYFTAGWVHTLTVYYQIWTLPALMTAFFALLPFDNPQ